MEAASSSGMGVFTVPEGESRVKGAPFSGGDTKALDGGLIAGADGAVGGEAKSGASEADRESPVMLGRSHHGLLASHRLWEEESQRNLLGVETTLVEEEDEGDEHKPPPQLPGLGVPLAGVVAALPQAQPPQSPNTTSSRRKVQTQNRLLSITQQQGQSVAAMRGIQKLRLVTKTQVAVSQVAEEQKMRDKIFGRMTSDAAEDTDLFRGAAASPWLILPGTGGKRVWDVCLGLLLVWCAVRAPYVAALDVWGQPGVFVVIDWVFYILLWVDIVLRFFRAHMDDGDIVATHYAIARAYVGGWFWVDLAAALPISFFSVASSDGAPVNDATTAANRHLHFFAMIHAVKLLRANRLESDILGWFRVTHQTRQMMRLGKLIVVIVAAAHIGACFWLYIDEVELSSPASWTSVYGIRHADNWTRYLSAFYWAFATLTSVGYGDISAGTNRERAVSIVMILLGALLFALTVGRLSALAQELNANKLKIRKRILAINQFVKARNLPKVLRHRTREYFDFVSDIGHGLGFETKILNDMSPSLRRAVAMHLNKSILESVPIFRYGGPGFQAMIVGLLKSVICLKGEYVIVTGEAVSAMYFLRSGQVQIVNNRGYAVTALDPGSFFGERWVLDHVRADMSVRCAVHSELYELAQDHVTNILAVFPEFEDTVRKVSSLRALHTRMHSKFHGEESDGDSSDDAFRGLEQVEPPFGISSWKDIRESSNFAQYYSDLLENSRMLTASEYDPKPTDLSRVVLPRDMRPLVEVIAQHTHEAWAQKRIDDGWHLGAEHDTLEKLHPDLLPYCELPDAAKTYDRDVAINILKMVSWCGYHVETEDRRARDNILAHVARQWKFGCRDVGEAKDLTYVPRPFPTQNVGIPEELDPLVQQLAKENHEAWARDRIDHGWSWGVKQDEVRRLHSCLVPFETLSEQEQETDLTGVEETVRLLLGLGFTISKEHSGVGKSFHAGASATNNVRSMRTVLSFSQSVGSDQRSAAKLSTSESVAVGRLEEGQAQLLKRVTAVEHRMDEMLGLLRQIAPVGAAAHTE